MTKTLTKDPSEFVRLVLTLFILGQIGSLYSSIFHYYSFADPSGANTSEYTSFYNSAYEQEESQLNSRVNLKGDFKSIHTQSNRKP